LLQQVGPNVCHRKHAADFQPEPLSSVDQEKLLRLALVHLEWKGFHTTYVAALGKEVAKFNIALHESLKPLHKNEVFNEIEQSLGLGSGGLTMQQRATLYIHLTCGPYLHFHLRCLLARNHRVSNYGLIAAFEAQHLQFVTQRLQEIRLINSYTLSRLLFLLWERSMNITRYECAQIMQFNAGINRIACKAPARAVVEATSISFLAAAHPPAGTASLSSRLFVPVAPGH
jgi:hypothetical protein